RSWGLGERQLLRIHPGEKDFDRGAEPRFAGHANHSTVLLDDPVDNREAQPGPGPRRLRGEEWLEYMRQGISVHPATRVAYGEHDVAARPHRPSPGGPADLPLARLDGEGAAGEHDVARVQRQ